MRISITTLLLLTLLTAIEIVGQTKTEEFKPNGKPAALIFTNFNTAFSDGETTPAFEIKRAYLGYEYNFSKEWFGRLTLDVGDPKVGSLQYTAFLKFAYMQYKKDNFKGLFGMIPTTQFKYSEEIWGYRYILRSYMDEFNFHSSADLGFTVDYEFTKNVSADFSVYNGEGYKSIQRDKFLHPAIGVTLKEVKNFTARIYADYMGKEVKQTTLAFFAGYTGKKLVVGTEYNYQWNFGIKEGQDVYGTSIYATFKPGDKIKYFARFDDLNSKTLEGGSVPWQLAKDGDLLIGGFEFGLLKGIKIAPNVRYWNPADESMPTTTYAYLNIELRY
jgi:hypothetical protein